MSGHSKWAQIKHRKAIVDKKKGQIFSKLVREITVAAKAGGDPAMNFKLRLALDRAKDAGMPKEAVERAVKRGTGEDKAGQLEEIIYEGYGPGGSAFLVEAATDNRNRTTSNVRHIFGQFQGNLAGQGSVSFLFTAKGQILIPKAGDHDLEELSLLAIDLGAEDVKFTDEGLEIYTTPLDLEKIKAALVGKGVKIASGEVIQYPQTTVTLADDQARTSLQALIEALEENEDVIAVHTNTNL